MRHALITIISHAALLLPAVLSAAFVQADDTEPALKESFQQHVQPLLNQYCVACHSEDEMMSGIRVDHLDASLPERHLRLWQGIRRQVANNKMPPKDEPQPTEAQRQQFINWIDSGLQVARSRPTPKNGSTRRLTVSQYRNTLRELLLLKDDLTDVLPPDAVSRDGFVNNQQTLGLSPLLLETYLDIAEKALDRSIVDPDVKPAIQNFRVDLGAAINEDPCPDNLILGANSLLLNNQDFTVTQLTASKPFDFQPFMMQTKYRFIEGYEGNATVRGWREYDSIYHAVFACMRGATGYPKGLAYSTVPQGLLLRPAIPNEGLFGVDSTYGPRANFKISLRELPDQGNFRVTVTAARYNDGLLLDGGAESRDTQAAAGVVVHNLKTAESVTIPQPGIYQLDVYTAAGSDSDTEHKPGQLTVSLGDRQFIGTLQQPAFLILRLPAGPLSVTAQYSGSPQLDRMVFTPLPQTDPAAQQFAQFEKRSPQLGVHLGLRRDCGSTLAQVAELQTVSSQTPTQFVFEGAISNFPNPDVEKDNVNYLAGIREIGVHSQYTDGRDLPRLLIRSVEFEGPYYESWPPAAHRRIFFDSPHKHDPQIYGPEVIRRFAAKAYRRPVTQPEEATLLAVFEESLASGRSFRDSVKDALQVVLTSPQFLFLIENSSSPAPEPIDDYELASKLSYFLWNQPPDEELLALAAAGRLHDELQAQTDRMIHDPRLSGFTQEFVSQWLSLEKFDVLEPDRDRFPKLTRHARHSLRQEPVQFFEHLVRSNLSVRNLIASDFVVANEVVADYYDLSQKPDTGFQFVAVPHARRELGGVFAQAAIMAGLSDGRESNPIKRGAWLARKIIAEPPADPPPNVPALEETTQQLTLRERLERHRNQPGCAQCHSMIDPWGIPFEEFDAGGRLKSEPVDAHSTLPDTTHVAGLDDLKQYLVNDRIDQVAFSVLRHLTTYACGQSLTYNELESLRANGVQLRSSGYRMQDLIQYVVHSPMFLNK
jgi:mono/diheme cytochrome c family protein